jgi:hypothetical protein
MILFLKPCIILTILTMPFDQPTPFEKSKGTRTATYDEVISWYEALDNEYKEINLSVFDTTDIGRPLHLVVISSEGSRDPMKWREQGKNVLLINNGIHPGEPEGIDASMMLARDLMSRKDMKKLLETVVVCIIPVYNVDGCLNRNSHSRANQNGPESYGFRGNYRNLDLNRDFIKCDSKNALGFTRIFQWCNPDVFVDTHTSNGADYQYTMTYITTQKDKLNPALSAYLVQHFLPALETGMLQKKHKMSPYVYTVEETPDSGLSGFMDSPRYSTGYAALFNTIGFMPETHMLKPFDERVKSTYDFLHTVLSVMHEAPAKLAEARSAAIKQSMESSRHTIDWKQDPAGFTDFEFDGYEAAYKKSDVSGQARLYYDRNKPFSRNIKYFNHFLPGNSVARPVYYIIPQCWAEVIERLQLNGVQMKRLANDTSLLTETYYLRDYKTTARPYEGHYLHSEVKIEIVEQQVNYFRGDYVVDPVQATAGYIMETLEPQCSDSYFAWNFFDAVLGQKEYYSDYVFEDLASELLQKDAGLKARFDKKKAEDKDFAADPRAQLDFIYHNSPYYEKSHLRYPVGRIMTKMKLQLE